MSRRTQRAIINKGRRKRAAESKAKRKRGREFCIRLAILVGAVLVGYAISKRMGAFVGETTALFIARSFELAGEAGADVVDG